MQVSGKFHLLKMAVCVAVIGKEVSSKNSVLVIRDVSFDPLEFIFTLELPPISSHGFSRRGAKISLHSAHFFGCCRGKG